MDWGIDPARVAEIAAIAQARRFSAREAEKFLLAITGGASENADMPLWDMLQALFALGTLAADARTPAREAAIGCLLDESGILLTPLRRGREAAFAGTAITSSSDGVTLAYAGKSRDLSWNRIRRALALADFFFATEGQDDGASGLAVLRGALDLLFSGDAFGDDLLRRAVQEPARFMRGWRKRNLPLTAFADLIRQREAFLAANDRRSARRDLDPDDLVGFWSFALDNGETWSFARFLERFSALMREERSGVGRRDFIAPASLDDAGAVHAGHDPEDALIAWLDREDEPLDLGDEESETPDDEEADGSDHELRELAFAALSRLPAEPKIVNEKERKALVRAFALQPLAHEQPLTLCRSECVAPWENRLVEASRRIGSSRGSVDEGAEPFDYSRIGADLDILAARFDEMLLIGVAIGGIPGPADDALRERGAKALKRWRHDRASFRMEDAKLAQTLARHQRELKTVARALHRIAGQQARLARTLDLGAQAQSDAARFADVFGRRYQGRVMRL